MKRRILAALAVFILLVPCFTVPSGAAFSGDDKIVIVIDPGHGEKDPGTSAGGIAEKDLTLPLARLIRDKLNANGSFTAYLTHEGDRYLTLAHRGIFANSVNADLLISIHFDSADGYSYKNGVSVFASVLDKYALTTLGASVGSAVASAVGMSNNGVFRREDNQQYYWNAERQWDIKGVNTGVLSDYYGIPTWCAKFGIKSLIVEHGYMSSPTDFAKITAPGALEKMANAEVAAIVSYYTNHAHTYGTVQTDFNSNCVFQGKQSVHCTVCGHRKNVTLLPAAPDNHFWINEKVTPASCGKSGSVYHECRITQNLNDKGYPIQNHAETATIPPIQEHEYFVKETVEAGHTTDGYKLYACRHCGYSFKDFIKAQGHTFDFVLTSEPTCTEAGGNLYRCRVCSYEYRDGPPAKGHDYKETAKTEPTCTADGEAQYQCAECGEKKTEVLPSLGHDEEITESVAPTCETDGKTSCRCRRCGEETEEKQEKLAHNFLLTSYTAASCEKEGSAEFVCANCKKTEKGKITPAGHMWTQGAKREASFFTKGFEKITCKNCGAEKNLIFAPEVLSSPAYILSAVAVLILAGAVAVGAVFLPRIYGKKAKAAEPSPLPVENEDTEETEEPEKTEETEEQETEENSDSAAEPEKEEEKEKEPQLP